MQVSVLSARHFALQAQVAVEEQMLRSMGYVVALVLYNGRHYSVSERISPQHGHRYSNR